MEYNINVLQVYFRTFTGASIFVFLFFFHALSVFVTAIPARAADPFSTTLRSVWQPITGPYVDATGQWQNWNLFSPDPSTKSVEYYIDLFEDGKRIETRVLSPESIPWSGRTNVLKILRNLSKKEEDFSLLRTEFLRSYCRRWRLLEAHELRLRVRIVDIFNDAETRESKDVSVRCT
jgi:hypothetical protein